MDPQNNNSFGSFGNRTPDGTSGGLGGGVNSGVGVSGQAMTYGAAAPNDTDVPGAIVSDATTAVDNNYTSPEFPQGGLTLGGGEKRSRKGLIIGLIVVFVLLIGGGLVALTAMNGMFGSSGGSGGGSSSSQSNVSDVRAAFNSYVNYVMNGVDSTADIDGQMFDDWSKPYFEGLTGDELVEYLGKTEAKSNVLFEYISGEYGAELYDMNIYYWWYAKIQPLYLDEIQEMYLRDGYDKTMTQIDAHFNTGGIEVASYTFDEYLDAAKKLALVELEIMKNIDTGGCIENALVKENCYNMPEEELADYDSIYRVLKRAENELFDDAMSAMADMRNVIYNGTGGENE